MYSEHITGVDDLNGLQPTMDKESLIELNLIYGIKVTRGDSLPPIVVFRT